MENSYAHCPPAEAIVCPADPGCAEQQEGTLGSNLDSKNLSLSKQLVLLGLGLLLCKVKDLGWKDR